MRFRLRLLALTLVLALLPVLALAQSTPNWPQGYIPSAPEWNLWFAKKQDYTGSATCTFSPCATGIETTANALLSTNAAGKPLFSSTLPSMLNIPSPQFSGAAAGGVLSGTFAFSTTGQLSTSNTTVSTSATTGALVVTGGLGIGGAIWDTGGIVVGSPTGGNEGAGTINAANLYVNGVAVGTGSGNVTGPASSTAHNLASYSDTTGKALEDSTGTTIGTAAPVALSNTTTSTSPTSGALVVSGGLGVGGAFNLAGTAGFAGVINGTNATAATSDTTGAITTAGGVGIVGSLYVGGAINGVGSGIAVTPGGGNTARTLPAIAGDTLNIADFGALGDATSDNAALTSALAALSGGGGTIVFPKGTWNFTGQFSYTITSSQRLTLMGAGSDSTVLQWSGAPAGIAITINSSETSSGCYGASVGVEGLSFVSGVTGGPTAFSTTVSTSCTNPAAAAPSLFRDVTVRGDYNTLYWGAGIVITKLSNVNFIADSFIGPTGSTMAAYGVELLGSSPQYAVAINFTGNAFINLGDGIGYGPYVQGVTVSQSNFTELDQCGINIPSGESGLLDQLTISNNQFGIVNNGGAGYICISSPIDTVKIDNNYFVMQGTTAGIYIGPVVVDRMNITHNTFSSNSQAPAIYLDQSGGAPLIDDNYFYEPTYAIVEASAAATAWLGSGNVYQGLASGVIDNTGGGGPSLICGASPAIKGYLNNMAGSIQPASGTNSCQITFAPAWYMPPQCTVAMVGNSANFAAITGLTNTALTIGVNGGVNFNGTEYVTYRCRQ